MPKIVYPVYLTNKKYICSCQNPLANRKRCNYLTTTNIQPTIVENPGISVCLSEFFFAVSWISEQE